MAPLSAEQIIELMVAFAEYCKETNKEPNKTDAKAQLGVYLYLSR